MKPTIIMTDLELLEAALAVMDGMIPANRSANWWRDEFGELTVRRADLLKIKSRLLELAERKGEKP